MTFILWAHWPWPCARHCGWVLWGSRSRLLNPGCALCEVSTALQTSSSCFPRMCFGMGSVASQMVQAHSRCSGCFSFSRSAHCHVFPPSIDTSTRMIPRPPPLHAYPLKRDLLAVVQCRTRTGFAYGALYRVLLYRHWFAVVQGAPVNRRVEGFVITLLPVAVGFLQKRASMLPVCHSWVSVHT